MLQEPIEERDQIGAAAGQAEATAQQDAASDARAGRQMGLAAVVVTVFLTVGKFMGLAKEMLLSSLGTGAHTDAFKFAYGGIIVTIYTKVEKLLRPTYLPEFVRLLREEGEEAAWRVASIVTGLQFLVLAVLSGAAMVWAEPLLLLLAPKLAETPADLARGVLMLRIMAPSLLLFSLSVMPELALQSYKRFTVPAVAEALFRTAVVALFAVLLTVAWPGRPRDAVIAAAWAVLVGGCLRFVAQIPALRSKLKLFRLAVNPAGSPSALAILKLMPPVVLGLIFASVRTWADMRFGNVIGEGAYTCLDFARRIPDMLLQTLAMAVSVVVYPFLSEWALRGEKDKLADALVSTTRALAFVFIPVSVALMLMSLPVIRLIYQHGQFSAQSAELSALGVYWYAPGLFFSSLDAPINHWFFALKDTVTPNLMGVVFVVVHVFTGWLGVYRVGQTAKQQLAWVAAALTISKTGKVVALYALLRRRIGRVDVPQVLLFAGRLAVCVAVMALALWATERRLTPMVEVWGLGVKKGALASMGASGLVGMVAFLGAAALLRMEEIRIVGDMARRGLRKVAGKLGARGNA